MSSGGVATTSSAGSFIGAFTRGAGISGCHSSVKPRVEALSGGPPYHQTGASRPRTGVCVPPNLAGATPAAPAVSGGARTSPGIERICRFSALMAAVMYTDLMLSMDMWPESKTFTGFCRMSARRGGSRASGLLVPGIVNRGRNPRPGSRRNRKFARRCGGRPPNSCA